MWTQREKKDEKEKDAIKEDTQLLCAGMLLGKDMVKFQIDSGTGCNIITINLLNLDTKQENSNSILVIYNQSKLRPMGKCKIKIRNPRNPK